MVGRVAFCVHRAYPRSRSVFQITRQASLLERIRFFTRPERHKPLLTRSQNFVSHSAATCPAYSEPSLRGNCTLSLETLRNRGSNRRWDLFFSLRRLFPRFPSVGPAVSNDSWPSVSIAASHRILSLDTIREWKNQLSKTNKYRVENKASCMPEQSYVVGMNKALNCDSEWFVFSLIPSIDKQNSVVIQRLPK